MHAGCRSGNSSRAQGDKWMRVRTAETQAASSRQRLMSRLCRCRTHKKGMVICRQGMRQSAFSLHSSSPLVHVEERCDCSE